MSSQLYRDSATQNGRLALVMVGLPATGKTFTARNLSRYLRWLGVRTRTFSVAAYRKQLLAGALPSADFFDPLNADCLKKRTLISEMALQDLIKWLEKPAGGQVGILDGSNTTPIRRQIIEQRLAKEGVKCVFVECLYPILEVERHVEELLLTCPEYAGVPEEEAVKDFVRRIQYYRPDYQTLSMCPPVDCGFIQLVNGGDQIIIERVHGYLFSRMIYYLMNLRYDGQRSIFLKCVVEEIPSSMQIENSLTTSQLEHLADGIAQCKPVDAVQIWTHTTVHLSPSSRILQKPRLRGLEPGTPATPHVNGAKINEEPKDLYFIRNPQGESYHDLAIRLEPLIMELEGMRSDVLIAADISVIRCIHGYFCEMAKQELVLFRIPENILIELKPRAYGCYEKHYRVIDDGLIEPITSEHLRLYNDNIVSP